MKTRADSTNNKEVIINLIVNFNTFTYQDSDTNLEEL